MAKTRAPGVVEIPRIGTFIADAVPDPFDGRDLEYRPRLQLLPTTLDQRFKEKQKLIYQQKGQSCTGHAVAAVINTALAPDADAEFRRASPYMLYRLARRYDELPGEDDAGSSLRGVLKGWFNHGAALEDEWPDFDAGPEPDLDDPAFVVKARDRPLGAFYRVNPYRLDDMQSAISELRAIVVSAVVHTGWILPTPIGRDGEQVYVIPAPTNRQSLGGHAFALVGYNRVGFLVQNSWGPHWGKGGFATLPYEDWLDSAYDAWVVRPGVPQTPFASGRNRAASVTNGALAIAPGPDIRRLAMHVVNLGNDGQLSTTGKFRSTPGQIDRAFQHMERWHDCWLQRGLTEKRHVMLWAHGGLVSEADGLGIAQKQLNWWLNNRVYPITFAWQSGPAETLVNQLVDMVKDRLPFGGLGFDLVEQFDRLVEKVCASQLRWIWDQMKENARAASKPFDLAEPIDWTPGGTPLSDLAGQPGASLAVSRLAHYVDKHGADDVVVHVAGHSAGSIFAAPLLGRLAEAGIKVETLTYLAPAIRVDEFRRDVLPHLGSTVRDFATFSMSDQRELDDVVGTMVGDRRVVAYQKSLLYLVSRAFERAQLGQRGEVPLVGMEKFFDQPGSGGPGKTLRSAVEAAGGACIFSPTVSPLASRTDATSHGGFDDDVPTMTSLVIRVRRAGSADEVVGYQQNAALDPVDGAPTIDDVAPVAASSPPSAQPFARTAETGPPGAAPVVTVGEPQRAQATAPRTPAGEVVEVASAPKTGSPVLDMLQREGWRPVPAPPRRRASRKKGARSGPRT